MTRWQSSIRKLFQRTSLSTRLYTARARVLIDPSAGARDVAGALRRTLSRIRLYGPDHDTSIESLEELNKLMTIHLRIGGDITLTVEEDSLQFQGRRVIQEDKNDWMIRTLFADGIASITFHTVMPRSSLVAYLNLWSQALLEPDDVERSIGTLIWEANIPGVTTRLRWAFGEFSGSHADSLRRHYLSLVGQIQSLRSEGVSSIEPSGTSSGRGGVTRAQPISNALSEPDRLSLGNALNNSSKGAGQRALLTLWRAFHQVHPEDQTEVLRLASTMIEGLVSVQRTQEIVRAFTRILSSAAGDPSAEAELERFVECLGNAEMIKALVQQVEAPSTSRDALFVLRGVPLSFAHFQFQAVLEHPSVRDQVFGALPFHRITPEQIALWVLEHGESTGEALIDVAAQISPLHLDAAIRIGLLQGEEQLALYALNKLSPQSADRYRSLIHQCADLHAEPAVYRSLDLLLETSGAHELDLFAKHLVRSNSSIRVRKLCVKSLAQLGGQRALDVLLKTYETSQDDELRIAIVRSMRQFTIPEATGFLTREAGKVFGDPALKDACRSVLKHIERRQAP